MENKVHCTAAYQPEQGGTYWFNKRLVPAVHTGLSIYPTVPCVVMSVWIGRYYIDGWLVHRYGSVRQTMGKNSGFFCHIVVLYSFGKG